MPTPAEVEAALKGWPDSLTAWMVLCEAHTEAESALRESEEKREELKREFDDWVYAHGIRSRVERNQYDASRKEVEELRGRLAAKSSESDRHFQAVKKLERDLAALQGESR